MKEEPEDLEADQSEGGQGEGQEATLKRPASSEQLALAPKGKRGSSYQRASLRR